MSAKTCESSFAPRTESLHRSACLDGLNLLRDLKSLAPTRAPTSPLRAHAQRSRHKRNYRSISRLCGSGIKGTIKVIQDKQTQTSCTSFVSYSSIIIFSASGTYHVRTSSTVGV